MTKAQKIKEQYVADVQAMSSKSRFGYFSLLLSHTAAVTDLPQTKAYRQENGRVHTEPRNIFSGTTSTGTLKKNYFSYAPSAFTGSPYEDPGKHQRKVQLQEKKKMNQKQQIYKPASLNKTIIKASYEYKSSFDPKKSVKNLRNADGKVITQPPNISTNPQSKIEFGKIKKFKYMERALDKANNKTADVKKLKITGEPANDQPFKLNSPNKQLFSTNVQLFFDADVKKLDRKPSQQKIIAHEEPFKPSCISPDKMFNPLLYKEQGNGRPEIKKITKQNKPDREAFKLTKIEHNSKPCPSISLSKCNLLRGYR